MSFWPELGFRQNPYATSPLPSDEEGEQLLVGRDGELERLTHTVLNGASHASLDGPNGVGKTSIVAILCERLRQRRQSHPSAAPFFPLKRPLNVTKGMTADDLLLAAAMEIAQALVRDRVEFGLTLASSRLEDLDKWLNLPLLKATGGGASALGFGGSASRSVSASGTKGFERSGLSALVFDVLAELFPTRQDGGMVAVLENVELAGGPAEVEELIGGIRDPLLATPGLRWILSGANGHLRLAAGSARLDGVVAPPIRVRPLSTELAPAVIDSRVRCYRLHENVYTPVDGAGFAYLLRVARGNLRTALRYCETYSSWAYSADVEPQTPAERMDELERWLIRHAEEALIDLDPLDSDAWTAFDSLASAEGTLELAHIDFAGGKQACEELERRGLAERAEDGDNVYVSLTRAAWLIHVIPRDRRV